MQDPEKSSNHGTFETRDSIDIWIDEQGDCTIRPIRPSLLPQAEAERARLIANAASQITHHDVR